MESSSLNTTERILPYQFEPTKESGDESSSDESWETVDEDSEVESKIKKKERNELDADSWCKCTHCQKMFLAVECICCTELEETERLLEKENIG